MYFVLYCLVITVRERVVNDARVLMCRMERMKRGEVHGCRSFVILFARIAFSPSPYLNITTSTTTHTSNLIYHHFSPF
jgi:hypothetical protein